ncbi:MoaD/ThiS family protein [Verrucomicrobiaceae bacterium N1E253]|uniref:MoaD/ThiS family protein n=1 Tax=Oceaniferula marina TaxID=2748318 RepID=A0A851GGJ2_9BACT|nr:MoaD/ThiS family protein [Oceaniferula marina]NWK54365.1 MoaD/ThiS family protein [Oceaniferula marina]
MHILLQGQLGALTNSPIIDYPLVEETTVADLIQQICKRLPQEAQQLILHSDGSLRQSLFVAIDDNHLRDLNTLIPPNTKELILMPPMAGG